MPARKTTREKSRSRMSTKAESESNELEDISSQSFGESVNDSVNYSRRSSSKVDRLSTNSSRKDRRTEDDTEEYLSDDRRKKKISKKNAKKSGSKESVDNLSDESFDDKDDEDTSEYKKNKKRRKSKRRSETHSHESAGERDSSSKKGSAKSKRKKRRSSEKDELPITEILKRAQEQRTRYEEPAPLAELTTDTIYVQGRNGFNAVRIGGSGKHQRRSSETPATSRNPRPIKVAIGFQKVWRSAGFIFQGLLGGMSMLHLIFMEAYFSDSEEFVNSYSALSEIYTSLYSLLIALCIISTFDMLDLAHGNHLRQIFKHHLKSILAIPMYIAAFALHQVTLQVDDKLTLLHYNSSNITYFLVDNVNETHGDIELGELKTWQRMTLSKDALVVLSWIFVSVGNGKDMLLAHLESMNNYAESVNLPM